MSQKRLFTLVMTVVILAGHLRAAGRPNIVVFFTDDHGWADLGSQGVEKDLLTPNLDQLAEGGLRAT